MNILFLFVSLPHLSEENHIFSSIVNEFKKKGHNVYVATKDLENRKHSEVVNENGIEVLRVVSHPFTGVSNPVKKALAYQEYVLKQRYLVKKHFGNKRIDIIFSHSLPPELTWVVGGLKSHFKCPFYLLQTDFTWQDAVAFGYFGKNSPICWYYRFWEARMMKLADYIGCPTKGNIEFILKYYPSIPRDRFQVVPFWQKPTIIDSKNNAKGDIPELKDKFIVVYGGSIGAAQRVEHLIELAEQCKDVKDIVFLVMGRGVYLPVIQKMAEDKGLTNVVFKEFMPRTEYMALMSSCDVGMIILHEKMATPNYPSKSLAYFNMKVPVLAALDHVTDFGEYLVENKAGLWAYSDDIPALKEKLMAYYNDRDMHNQVKENAYNMFINDLLPEHAYKKIMSKIKI